jgi:deazaflavin-dependent oxidoreductase (nitroreductase family)
MESRVGQGGVARRRPSGVAVWLLHLPVLLYRLGLGWLLGYRFAQITHRGRKSGRVYRSVVEVVRFEPATREVVVLAAWGGRTDWYRNLQAAPALEIRIGRLRFVPEQRLLSSDQTFHEVQLYASRHRIATRLMLWLFGLDPHAPTQVTDFFKAVSFRPRQSQATPMGAPLT